MTIKLGVVMDPLHTIKIKKDSTVAMLIAAQKRQWPIYFMEQKDLFVKDGRAYATMQMLTLNLDATPWFQVQSTDVMALDELNVILMRKDPPFNLEYIYTTQILELAEKNNVLIVNKPQSLRDANEKLFISHFPQCCPPTLVSRNMTDIKHFVKEYQQVVFKPLDSMGGRSIFLVNDGDPNITVILETLTQFETQFMMAQKFIPEIKNGDKRILLINGEPVPYALARIPQSGDIRGNLAAGGKGVGIEINDRDRWICAELKSTLQQKGLMFVGIDVIGDYLTEINVTSPTCIREIDSAFNCDISGKLLDAISDKLNT